MASDAQAEGVISGIVVAMCGSSAPAPRSRRRRPELGGCARISSRISVTAAARCESSTHADLRSATRQTPPIGHPHPRLLCPNPAPWRDRRPTLAATRLRRASAPARGCSVGLQCIGSRLRLNSGSPSVRKRPLSSAPIARNPRGSPADRATSTRSGTAWPRGCGLRQLRAGGRAGCRSTSLPQTMNASSKPPGSRNLSAATAMQAPVTANTLRRSIGDTNRSCRCCG